MIATGMERRAARTGDVHCHSTASARMDGQFLNASLQSMHITQSNSRWNDNKCARLFLGFLFRAHLFLVHK